MWVARLRRGYGAANFRGCENLEARVGIVHLRPSNAVKMSQFTEEIK